MSHAVHTPHALIFAMFLWKTWFELVGFMSGETISLLDSVKCTSLLSSIECPSYYKLCWIFVFCPEKDQLLFLRHPDTGVVAWLKFDVNWKLKDLHFRYICECWTTFKVVFCFLASKLHTLSSHHPSNFSASLHHAFYPSLSRPSSFFFF